MMDAKEDAMNTRKSIRIAALLSVALAAATVHADSFEELYSVGSVRRLHEAAGAFVPVFDEDGARTNEHVFLLHGGYLPVLDAQPVSDLWALAGGSWQHLSYNAPAMANHALVAAADGRAWAVGAIGNDGWLQPLDTLTAFEIRREDGRLDVVVEQVRVDGPCPDVCFGAAAVAADGGRSILVVGGSCLGNPLSPAPGQLWEYRFESNRWYRRADMPVDISDHTAVVARDFVWVFGGNGSTGSYSELYRYDLLTDAWSRVDIDGERPDSRSNHRAAVAGNKMLVFGGVETPSHPDTIDEIWQLDLDTLIWTEKSAMSTGLAGMAMDVVPSGLSGSRMVQVLIYGGVVDAWSLPYDLSDSTSIYTSDVRTPLRRANPRDAMRSSE
jgi:hypothetical protein